jgi:hypothetical protein
MRVPSYQQVRLLHNVACGDGDHAAVDDGEQRQLREHLETVVSQRVQDRHRDLIVKLLAIAPKGPVREDLTQWIQLALIELTEDEIVSRMEESLLGQARTAPVFEMGFGTEERTIPVGNPNGLKIGEPIYITEKGEVLAWKMASKFCYGHVLIVESARGRVTIKVRDLNEG